MILTTPNLTQSLPTLPALVKSSTVFRGSKGNSLLAPRGVWAVDGRLMVSDTGQNRVFIWNQIPTTEYAEPDVVLGQVDAVNTGRNAGGSVGADTLQYPSGLWSDGERLIVADAWNHRVLIWNHFPTQNGQPADIVLGQADFTGSQPNGQGIGAAPSERTLNWPYGVTSDGQRLWIADTGNRRVLFYDHMPTESLAPATAVIGQPDFTERDYDSEHAIWPYSVRIGPDGQLAVVDTQYYRTLIWHDWRTAPRQQADVLVGQPDFGSNGQNQYGLFPAQQTLNWTYDAHFYRHGLLVADTGNSRILWFDTVPTQHNQLADNLIGHASFSIGSENASTRFGTDKQLYWPFSISTDGDQLCIADTGNHRIIIGQLTLTK
ncbi:NHL repeat-containing protein [Spirosoma flavum]|uniref:NHL repeat containing protein n=1 Tax=Spirosoma flavum TaxID=2048557 RepID=A0ABW6AM70_9BACT